MLVCNNSNEISFSVERDLRDKQRRKQARYNLPDDILAFKEDLALNPPEQYPVEIVPYSAQL